MALPAPNLDDRRFQDLVDDAKRMVMRKCPEWTDHNVSDPGVTLIETFAFMTDQLLYRLNRVPDRLYVKFLELIGLRLLPPTPAAAPVTFWLSAPAVAPLTVPTGTAVGTLRSELAEPVVFSTLEDLTVIPCTLTEVRTGTAGELADAGTRWAKGEAFPAFGSAGRDAPAPEPDDVLCLGLSAAVPRCAVRVDFRGQVEGVGVDPRNPPLVWEALTDGGWVECEVTGDETGGLNRSGPLVVHVPPSHVPAILDGTRAGWLRARVVQREPGQPGYTDPPMIRGLAAGTVGGTVDALHAEVVQNEPLGASEGVAGQAFPVNRAPVLGGAGEAILDVSGEDGWVQWTQVEHFADSGPRDEHFVLDAASGMVHFGPAVREPAGGMRQHGAVPPKDAAIRLRRYTIGGGATGNVGRGAIRTLKSSIPFVAAVENRRRAQGGVDGETLAQARQRAPIMLRTRSRAVTAEDYEAIARETAPEVSRVRCLTAGEEGVDAGSVRVLVVPAAARTEGRLSFPDLVPDRAVLDRIAARLDEVRLLGARVVVEPPLYRGVTVVATAIARPRVDLALVQHGTVEALYAFLDPITGGPDGAGWEFGRPVHAGDVFGVLQRVRGVEAVENVRLYGANPITGERGPETARLDLPPNSLVFSFGHQVRVVPR